MPDNWSEPAGILIDSVEPTVKQKYNMSLRGLLASPGRYSGTANLNTTIDNIREDIDNYVSETIDSMPEERKSFESDALKCDSITKQLGQNISLQAKQNSVPMIKPDAMDRDETRDEVFYISSVDNSVLSLVQKLVAASTVVADFSRTYRNYNIGEWLFSTNAKNYVIRVNLQPNAIVTIDAARDEVNGLLDGVMTFASK
ncbi:hypothetical protein M1329_01270 [Candidatus Marsarchaeota archaeon]|jgi:hypothetical protein|nr:hypothetical protein [Candidatus Marsarchaeota archaeon]MCL5100299.1 hypothetical protein [Candidatus Marsarchaeota archaeon]